MSDNKNKAEVSMHGGLICQHPSQHAVISQQSSGLAMSQNQVQSNYIAQAQKSYDQHMQDLANAVLAQQQAFGQNYYGSGILSGIQSTTRGASINVEGENLTVSQEDYNYIILEGYKALKKREEYRSDFDTLINKP